MLKRKAKSKLHLTQDKLNNLIIYLERLIISNEINDYITLFLIVKIFVDKINNEQNIELLTGKIIKSLIFDLNGCDNFLTSTKKKVSIEKSFSVYLGYDPIITKHWSSERLVSCLEKIGSKENHKFQLFLPIGITVVYNGNHSIQTGIIKKVGKLDYYPDINNIYDISYLYDEIYFDGNNYCNISNNKFICEANFECGCLFEIGRLLHKYNISYLDLKQDSNFNFY